MRYAYMRQTRGGLCLSIDQQLDVMADAKCQRLVIERPVKGARLPCLAAILKNIKNGDALVVCEFPTLSVSSRRIKKLALLLEASGANLIVLSCGVDMAKRGFIHTLICIKRYEWFELGMAKEACRERSLIDPKHFQ